MMPDASATATAHPRRQARSRFNSTVLLVAALGALALPSTAAAQNAVGAFLQRAAASRAKGENTAPVLVYEFADFQCPHCARFSREVFPEIDTAYVRTGQVQWVFVNLPIPSNVRAWGAAEAALCAGGVADRFWPMHDRLFAAQEEWTNADDAVQVYLDYAKELALPVDEFEACLLRDGVAPILLEDVMSAVNSRIEGTPTFVIDDETHIVGVRSFAEWRETLDSILNER